MAFVEAGLGQKIKIQDAATSGAGVVIVPSPNINYHRIYLVTSDATTSAGKVKAETAHDPGFAGTWALEGTEQTLVRNTEQEINFVGARAAIRANISVSVTGGATLDAYYLGV